MNNKIKGLYITHINNKITYQQKTIVDTLANYYQLLKCTTIETYTIKLNNAYYVLIFDEEGKIHQEPKEVSLLLPKYRVVIVGDIFITKLKSLEAEQWTSLTQTDINNLIKYLQIYDKDKTIYYLLTD